MQPRACPLLVLVTVFSLVESLDNGLALTPPMGWLTWQRFRCQIDCKAYPHDCISEDLIVRQAKRLAQDGWLKLGYEYVIVDDCWSARERDPKTRRLVPDPQRFPHGIKWLSHYVHSLGLKFGIYLDFGTKTCAGYPGSQDYLEVDAYTMADWGVDFIKMDGCSSDLMIQADGYERFGRLLNATGRPIVFGCSYPLFQPWRQGAYLNWTRLAHNCNLWRLLEDIQDSWTSLRSIMSLYENNRYTLIPVAGPGHWNDLDMLLGGNFGLSVDETRVQMGMWAMHASPLILSVDLETISPEMKAILQAKYVIHVSQDRLGLPAERLDPIDGIQIWKRRMAFFNAGWAVAFLHLSDETGFPKLIVTSLRDLRIPDPDSKPASKFMLFDAFTKEQYLNVTVNEPLEVRINPSGITMVIVHPLP